MTSKATDEFGSTVEIGDEILVKSTWYFVEKIDIVGDTAMMECIEQGTGEWAVIDYDEVDHIAIRSNKP